MEKILTYKKFKNLIDIKSFEVKMSLIGSGIILIILNKISFYKKFFIFQDNIINIMESTVFGFLGLIGFLISALSITVGMLSKNVIKEIISLEKDELLTRESIETLIYDFIFLGFIISIQILMYICTLLFLYSDLKIINIYIFIPLTFIHIYIFLFIIFSSVSMLVECYDIFVITIKIQKLYEYREQIKKEYQEIEKNYKDYYKVDIDDFEKYIKGLITYIESKVDNEKKKEMLYECLIETHEYNYINKKIQEKREMNIEKYIFSIVKNI